MKKAFTLVELLIVIAILGILGVGLLIALDPLEQTRRASDTTVQQSGIEVKDAINRYFASKLVFPWCDPLSAAGTCSYEGTSCFDDEAPQGNFGDGGSCAGFVINQLLTTGELKNTPPSKIAEVLNLYTRSSGTEFTVTFNPVSKAFDSDLKTLYIDQACTAPAINDPPSCNTSGNDCYYCLK
ncbi:hypothetical protein A2954_00175 [Candidatus Roizmanbacteria bacterium RIFCSPLOWO2_01_FULL_37_12]|uniref:Type II secretion system protein GspG C-terminal domain-containing protein n=1 Tax=Candidatus Roizmanbacteria bacterium RIFCSPLOWO2_01_FULL_37_12 TaxID=1802056 RepID=A0A1F7IB50_9BACT|nr:MAG: hypothetical protein A2768_00610 [Candidatus Roizmanbacteria bacterium RIFCSPHIGHO2_01_FULL_37_16]OGK24866.1 MAG: hypothetical protein A3D76_07095 [Candidatus Roizmanbacteria bacterium RIFCSPHIGHO2_02_FULL_37_9b]OGK40582.1 MAG: hypothetical protein A2954_00175 [Candidatus Roizmanbacteria bacterium RIFCSPLOWO2_01_FULL_37_12]